MKIPVVIFKDQDSIYGASVPDIPGLHSCGNTLEEALRNTLDALHSHIELLHELGEEIGLHPSPLKQLQAHPDYAGGTWHHIHIDPAILHPKRIGATFHNSTIK
ncbi:type II toxin-antitoxin system HicB family antitoxin [Duganella qianjiadongensis]|uniref:CopG family transcriptional regulator n=1 Tax=Duganella qianjiadongensis TaxID=2692176 RepID=A0ABW9VI88_9BURK|nr:type II toxin-antitoxin system HicB family antitoxin [Duganella qianjiadongensis]MYM39168.1 CopG family transcriptional regulator [Duganella qianjiadongensis]